MSVSPSAHRLLVALLLILVTTSVWSNDEISSDSRDRQTLGLTVYNGDLALVRDRRTLTLPSGRTWLAFADVSAQIRPESARLHGGPTVLEQRFDFDLLSPEKLLEHSVGQSVGLVRIDPDTGTEYRQQGTLLSVNGSGVVFRIDDRIETGGPDSPWRFVFDKIPATVRQQPTLSLLLDSARADNYPLELTYLTQGLSWQADYIATLASSGRSLELTGWITLTNTSGTDYPDAVLQLLAGDVNQVPEVMALADESAMSARATGLPRQERLFEYHLYSLDRPTTLADNQTKQVLLMQADTVPVRREYRVDVGFPYIADGESAGQPLAARILLRFGNSPPALGDPLPAGIVRFYQRDSEGDIQFIGENRIEHTPEGRVLELAVGNAFDVTAERRQTHFRQGEDNQREIGWAIDLFNAKPEPVEVVVQANFPGQWQMLDESVGSERVGVTLARWTVPVAAKGQATLRYRVLLD